MDSPPWDPPLWDPLDSQGLVPNQDRFYVEDHGQCDFAFHYNHDTIEEDALNEKSCVQVLRILIHKADEDIIKLEEDILMLECQLAWDNEEWSKPCSAALKKIIDHLDVLIHSSKNEVKYAHDFTDELEEPGRVTQKLHDIVKPLLENYILVKSKKNGNSSMVVPSLPSSGLANKKMEANTSKLNKKVDTKKRVKRKKRSPSKEPKEQKKIYTQTSNLK